MGEYPKLPQKSRSVEDRGSRGETSPKPRTKTTVRETPGDLSTPHARGINRSKAKRARDGRYVRSVPASSAFRDARRPSRNDTLRGSAMAAPRAPGGRGLRRGRRSFDGKETRRVARSKEGWRGGRGDLNSKWGAVVGPNRRHGRCPENPICPRSRHAPAAPPLSTHTCRIGRQVRGSLFPSGAHEALGPLVSDCCLPVPQVWQSQVASRPVHHPLYL